MSAKDLFHDAVRKGLEKDGWTITNDPLHLRIGGVLDMYIDLGAEKIIAAQKGEQKIAVEIKSFIGASTISEFHLAVGQFINYRYALEDEDPERILYLAVPQNTYNDFFNLPFIKSVIHRSQLRIIVYDIEQEAIVQWQP